MPLITVIMSVYNKELYINKSIESVLSQSLVDIELICVNDGSIDNSLQIIRKYTTKDKRVILCDQNNAGAGSARNLGMKYAKGEYISFIDADDFYCDNNVLMDLYNIAKDKKADICGGELILYDDCIGVDNKKHKEYNFEKEGFQSFYGYQQDYGFTRFIYKREFLKENKIEFPSIRYHEDPVFFVKALSSVPKFYCTKRSVYYYRVNHKTSNLSLDQVIGFLQGATLLLEITENKYNRLYAQIVNRINSPWFTEQILRFKSVEEVSEKLDTLFSKINWRIVFREIRNFEVNRGFIDANVFSPKVSVIVPIYNVERYLNKCLTSIAVQTYRNIEVICVDNNSTDKSREIILEWVKKDNRFRFMNSSDQGLGPTRNCGMNDAKGYFYYFVDSDDYIDPNTIKTVVSKMQYDNDFVVHGVENIAENSTLIDVANNSQGWFDSLLPEEGCHYLGSDFKKELPSVAWNKLYRAQKIIENNISFENIINEDEVFFWEYLLNSKKYYSLDNKFYKYLRRSDSIMGTRDLTDACLDIFVVHKYIRNLVIKKNNYIKFRKCLIRNFIQDISDLYFRSKKDTRIKVLSSLRNYIIKNEIISVRLWTTYYRLHKNFLSSKEDDI